MKMIVPMQIAPSMILSTNVPEDDTYPAWDAGTNYYLSNNDIVYSPSTQLRYAATQDSIGKDPASEPDYWTAYGTATRWRPFEGVVARYAERVTSLYYQIEPDRLCDGLAIFNLNGGSIQVEIENASAAGIYDQTHSLVDKTGMRNWLDWITWQPDYRSSFVTTGLPAFAGYKVTITNAVGVGSDARIGELVMGRTVKLGRSLTGGDLSYEDYSSVETNAFGERDFVERDYAKRTVYEFLVERGDEERVLSLLASRRAKPTVFLTDETHKGIGTLSYGLPVRPQIVLEAGPHSVCRMTVEDMI